MGTPAAERQRRSREKKQREIDAMPKIPCACGCGEMIAPITKRREPAQFAHGHNETAHRWKPGENLAEKSPTWKGGRFGHNGYIMVYVGAGHPMAKKNGSYAFEHRYVMSEMLGRPLVAGESVHHINGDRTDNRPENLQLRVNPHGNGIAYCCGECGSRNITPIPLDGEL